MYIYVYICIYIYCFCNHFVYYVLSIVIVTFHILDQIN